MSDEEDDDGWDWGQMFTPPKSKSPWTAMTAGSTGEWARDTESWGPVIMALLSKVPYVGPLLGAAGGAAGMGGRGSGYQGSDYGDANWGSTIGGAVKGLYGGDYRKAIPGAVIGTAQSMSNSDNGENSVSPEANKYNSSWYGGLINGIEQNVGNIGNIQSSFGNANIGNGQTSGTATIGSTANTNTNIYNDDNKWGMFLKSLTNSNG